MSDLKRPEQDRPVAATLTVSSVHLSFGGLQVLDEVTFTVAARTVLGIIGPNGSGKTSLLNCISGVYRPDAGDIRLDDRRLRGTAPHLIAAAGVGRTFQHVEVPQDLTCLELTMLGRHTKMRRYGLAAYGIGIPFLTRYETPHREAGLRALERVGLHGRADTLVGDLPYGLAKRADVARALAGEPRLLLLDEPAAGLNEAERGMLADLIAELADGNLTICLVEHDMTFVTRVCSNLLVLAAGHKVFEGTTDSALADSGVVETFMGSTVTRPEPQERTVHGSSSGLIEPSRDAEKEN